MNRETLKKKILEITDWRHPFEIESGLWVTLYVDWFKEWHQWRIKVLMPNIETMVQHIFPDSGLKSARVLDIGCWDGFYGFEFLKRGAKFLKGIDLRDEAIRRANLLKKYFNYTNCQFEIKNIQDKQFHDETYDISLMYGVLYHLSSPIDVVKAVGDITSSLILVSTYASGHSEPVLRLKRESPEKDSTGSQELITTPSELAVVEMLDFAGFDIVLRDYPYPFFERYKSSDFGFFYGIKSSVGKDKVQNILEELQVGDRYNPRLKRPQIIRLRRKSVESRGHRGVVKRLLQKLS